MKLAEVKRILEADVISSDDLDSVDVEMACGADLMSDVLAHIEAGSLLLTGLTNPQVVRTAEMASVVAICFVRGKRPLPETISLAQSKGVPLLATNLPMFESCGLLFAEGLPGCSRRS
jgi:predicted transcriptional regulator